MEATMIQARKIRVRKLQPRYTDEQLRQLDDARFSQKTDVLNRRVNAVYFYGQGHTHCQAAKLANISRNTLYKSIDAFASGGIPAMTIDGRQGPPSALDPHVETIRAEFEARPPASVAQAAGTIAAITGVALSNSRIRGFMHEIGMSVRHLSPIPGKADPQVQAAFKKTIWTPCSKKPPVANATSAS